MLIQSYQTLALTVITRLIKMQEKLRLQQTVIHETFEKYA